MAVLAESWIQLDAATASLRVTCRVDWATLLAIGMALAVVYLMRPAVED